MDTLSLFQIIQSAFSVVWEPWFFSWVVVPILIFLARVTDVSMGTMRVVFISKGFKIAPLLGFFEILIWLVAIQQIMVNLTNPFCYIAYAAGFSTGTFIGMSIEERISIGKAIIRVIVRKNPERLMGALTAEGYGVTGIDAHGPSGKVKDILVIIDRQDVRDVVRTIKKHNPNAFYSIEDARYVSNGGIQKDRTNRRYMFGFYRKGK